MKGVLRVSEELGYTVPSAHVFSATKIGCAPRHAAVPAAAGAASGALPPRYELNEDGEYKTAADMRAAYIQLRYAHAQHQLKLPNTSRKLFVIIDILL